MRVVRLSLAIAICALVPSTTAARGEHERSDADSDAACEFLYLLDEESLSRADECPVIFGDEEERQANRLKRHQILSSVTHGPAGTVVVHTSDWEEPLRMDFAHLQLIATSSQPGCPPFAIVELRLDDDELVCDGGFYLLQRDYQLGNHAAVLAILEDLVLIEYQGELRYILLDGYTEPEWRMVFRSTFDIIFPLSGQVTSSGGKASQTPQQRRQEQLRQQRLRRQQQQRRR